MTIGERTVAQAILHDVSERERIERELRRAVERLEELYHLAIGLGGTRRAGGRPRGDDARPAARRAGGRRSSVSRATRSRSWRSTRTARSSHEGRMPLAGTPCEHVRRDTEPCTFTDAAQRFPTDAFLVERGIMTYVGVPIVGRNDQVVGRRLGTRHARPTPCARRTCVCCSPSRTGSRAPSTRRKTIAEREALAAEIDGAERGAHVPRRSISPRSIA